MENWNKAELNAKVKQLNEKIKSKTPPKTHTYIKINNEPALILPSRFTIKTKADAETFLQGVKQKINLHDYILVKIALHPNRVIVNGFNVIIDKDGTETYKLRKYINEFLREFHN